MVWARGLRIAVAVAVIAGAWQGSGKAEDAPQTVDVDALDLKANPKRFSGQWIRVRHFQCYAAGKDDYRCINPEAGVAVASIYVTPDSAKGVLDQDCSTVRAAAAKASCGRPFVFKVIGWREDRTNPAAPLLVMTAGHIEVE